MHRNWFAAFAATVILFGAGFASADFWDMDFESHRTYTIQVTGGLALQEIGGDLALEDGGGSNLDFKDILDFDQEESYWVRVDFQPFLRHHLRFTYTPLEWKGGDNLDQGITVNGQFISSNQDIDTKLELTSYDLAYRWDALFVGEQLTVSPIINLSLLDVKGSVKNDETVVPHVSESDSFLAPVPSLGLRFEGYPIKRIGMFAEAKGMTIGKKATTWDVEGGLSLYIFNNLNVHASYRYLVYDVDYSNVLVDAKIHGPYLGMGFRF